MDKWQAREARVRQELATDISKVLDTPERRVEPLPRFGWKFIQWVQREIIAEAPTQPLKAK